SCGGEAWGGLGRHPLGGRPGPVLCLTRRRAGAAVWAAEDGGGGPRRGIGPDHQTWGGARSLAGDDRGLRTALDGIEQSFGAWRDAETRVAARAPGAREGHLAAVWEGRL
ncbi:MAG: hypothetical protein LBG60_09260, partial [Bifidobacteriaceae bacterium]|nr:hypothetical protein [Bifidobacteriaceae bacterium]